MAFLFQVFLDVLANELKLWVLRLAGFTPLPQLGQIRAHHIHRGKLGRADGIPRKGIIP